MAEFFPAKKDIVGMAEELIGKFHPEIATADIAYLFKDKASAKEIEEGQENIDRKR